MNKEKKHVINAITKSTIELDKSKKQLIKSSLILGSILLMDYIVCNSIDSEEIVRAIACGEILALGYPLATILPSIHNINYEKDILTIYKNKLKDIKNNQEIEVINISK